MDSYRKALMFWQQQPARQRHWMTLGVLLGACLLVALGWIAPRWAQVQQAPAQIEQLQRQWEELSGMAQTLKQKTGNWQSSGVNTAEVSDEAMLQTLRQMLDGCGQVDIANQLMRIDMQGCSATQLAQTHQWLDTNSRWLTKQVELEASATSASTWQGTWVWQR
jgi:cell division protein FtsB